MSNRMLPALCSAFLLALVALPIAHPQKALFTQAIRSPHLGLDDGATPTTVPNGIRINAGGDAIDAFSADSHFSDGGTYHTDDAVETRGVADAGPMAIYQSERHGTSFQEGNPIVVPYEVDLKTGLPKPGTDYQSVMPDAVSFDNEVIVDDKPLNRDIAQDRQEMIRYIKAYEIRQGLLPKAIEIHRYDSAGVVVRIDAYPPERFLL